MSLLCFRVQWLQSSISWEIFWYHFLTLGSSLPYVRGDIKVSLKSYFGIQAHISDTYVALPCYTVMLQYTTLLQLQFITPVKPPYYTTILQWYVTPIYKGTSVLHHDDTQWYSTTLLHHHVTQSCSTVLLCHHNTVASIIVVYLVSSFMTVLTADRKRGVEQQLPYNYWVYASQFSVDQ